MTSGAGSRPRSRRAFSSACSARDLELLARLVGAPALDRVAHGARQALPVDLALDQVVLRARADGLHPAPLVVEAGEDEHRESARSVLSLCSAARPCASGRSRSSSTQSISSRFSRRASASVVARTISTYAPLMLNSSSTSSASPSSSSTSRMRIGPRPPRGRAEPVDGLWRSQDEWVTAAAAHSTQPPEAQPVPGCQGTAVACSGW